MSRAKHRAARREATLAGKKQRQQKRNEAAVKVHKRLRLKNKLFSPVPQPKVGPSSLPVNTASLKVLLSVLLRCCLTCDILIPFLNPVLDRDRNCSGLEASSIGKYDTRISLFQSNTSSQKTLESDQQLACTQRGLASLQEAGKQTNFRLATAGYTQDLQRDP